MDQPVISIIVPVYNTEAYLPRCLDSILRQTYSNFELILIDDGSTDKSGAVCDYYSAQDNRIRVIHKTNGGVSAARNVGINLSLGEYIVFVDSDDEISNSYLFDLYSEISQSNVDLSLMSFTRISGSSRDSNLLHAFKLNLNSIEPEQRDLLVKLAKYFLLYGPVNKIFQSRIIHDKHILFDETISFGEDVIFVFRYLSFCDSLSYIPRDGYYYYNNPGSLMHQNRDGRFENSIKINGAIKTFYQNHGSYTDEMQQEISTRIFLDAYCEILQLYNGKPNNNWIDRYKKTKGILSNTFFVESARFVDTTEMSKCYSYLLKKQKSKAIFLILSILSFMRVL